MKKYLYMALAAAAVLVSCKKEPKAPAQVVEETPEYAEGATPVEFTSNLREAIQTKSYIGALDQWHADQKLFIYGIAREGLNAEATEERDLDLSYDSDNNVYPGILINNVKAEAFAYTPGFDLTKKTHQPIKVLRVKDAQNPANDEYFYYEEDRRYEFFGYYVDDAAGTNPAPTIHNGENDEFKGISLDVEINGSQDIMLATTDHDDDNEANINPNRIYSAYSSRKGVRPNLVFKHQLSRFNVYVKSGDPSELAEKVTLTTVEVETNNTGTLRLAHKAHVANKPDLVVIKKVPNEKNLATGEIAQGAYNKSIHDVDEPQPFIGIWNPIIPAPPTGGEDTPSFTKQLSTSAANPYTLQMTTAWQKAGTIMVMPEKDEYMLKLGIKQQGYMGGTQETFSFFPINFENIVQPKDDAKHIYDNVNDVELDNAAVAGHAYDVNVIIYGLQEVHIEVTMTEWEQNGSFNMDPDNDYEYKISLGAEDNNHNKANPREILIGQNYQINAVSTPMERPEEAGFVYESKDPTVATVDANGLVTAVAPGKVRIDVKIPAYNKTTGVGDPKRPEGGYTAMWFYVPKLVLGVTGGKTFNKEVADAPFTPAYTVKNDADTPADIDGATMTFASDNEAVATVDANGEITLVGAGVAHITVNATKEGYGAADEIKLTVNVAASPHLVITVDKGLNIVKYADDVNLTPNVTVTDDAATPAAVATAVKVYGQSDDTDVVEVNTTTGELDFKAAGVAHYTISATAAGYVGAQVTVTVTVNALNQYTVTLADAATMTINLATSLASLPGGATPVDLSTFITSIKEGDTDVNPALTFTLVGDPAYDKASIAGANLTLLDGAAVDDTMTIKYTIAANAANHYDKAEGTFIFTVVNN